MTDKEPTKPLQLFSGMPIGDANLTTDDMIEHIVIGAGTAKIGETGEPVELTVMTVGTATGEFFTGFFLATEIDKVIAAFVEAKEATIKYAAMTMEETHNGSTGRSAPPAEEDGEDTDG